MVASSSILNSAGHNDAFEMVMVSRRSRRTSSGEDFDTSYDSSSDIREPKPSASSTSKVSESSYESRKTETDNNTEISDPSQRTSFTAMFFHCSSGFLFCVAPSQVSPKSL